MRRFDFTILSGLAVGIVCVGAGAALEGIRPQFLWQPAAALVVLGGTAGAVIVKRGFGGLWRAWREAGALFFKDDSHVEQQALAARLAWLVRAAQREGVRAYENYAETCADQIVKRGLLLAAEYAEPASVRAALDRALDEEDEEGRKHAATFEAAAGFAPTFGILGAVLGLIHVLRVLDQPGALGLGIATAFVATIYGIGLANLFLFPLAARMRERHATRIKRREELADALVALAAHADLRAVTRNFSLVPDCAIGKQKGAAR